MSDKQLYMIVVFLLESYHSIISIWPEPFSLASKRTDRIQGLDTMSLIKDRVE